MSELQKHPLKQILEDIAELKSNSGWQDIELIEGSSSSNALQVRKIGKVVNICGSVDNIEGTKQIAQLEEKYKPSKQIVAAGRHGDLQINTDGKIYTLDASGSIGINLVYFAK